MVDFDETSANGLLTQSLYISQAIQLCSNTLQDQTWPGSERAIALGWLGHLVGDAPQPCHARSLYVEEIFPEGDRGANSIRTKQGGRKRCQDSIAGTARSVLRTIES
jgi:hypothetical protein